VSDRVQRPKGPKAAIPQPARTEPKKKEAERAIAETPLGPIQRDDRQKRRENERAIGEERIGDASVTAPELMRMGSWIGARHLMVLLAKLRKDRPRAAVIAHVGDLLIETAEPAIVRRLLLEMTDAGRIVDVYPLEVLAYVLERRADLVEGFAFGRVILNKEALESTPFSVDDTIILKVPLSLKMRQFGLEDTGTPGYWFAPGPPGEYHFEVGQGGTFRVIVRGDIRKESLVDRVAIRVEDPPEPPA
jgi:hypothetical protein